MGAPVGPTGCNASSKDDSRNGSGGFSSGWQIGVSYGQFWSHLHFNDGYEPTLNQHTVVGSGGVFFSNGWSFRLSAGVIAGGKMKGGGESFTLNPGWLISVQGARQWFSDKGWIPFFITSLAFSVSGASTDSQFSKNDRIIGTDVRISLTAGYTLFNFLSLYISPRFFGGPVSWTHNGKSVRGRDRYFFQSAAGLAFLLPAGLTLFADSSPFGEQSITAGVAVSF